MEIVCVDGLDLEDENIGWFSLSGEGWRMGKRNDFCFEGTFCVQHV